MSLRESQDVVSQVLADAHRNVREIAQFHVATRHPEARSEARSRPRITGQENLAGRGAERIQLELRFVLGYFWVYRLFQLEAKIFVRQARDELGSMENLRRVVGAKLLNQTFYWDVKWYAMGSRILGTV